MRFHLPVFAIFALAGSVVAQVPTIPGFQISKPPVIDGVIHEDGEWKGAPNVSGMFDEITAEKAVDGGTFWVAYDSKFIYVGARLVDSQPSLIRATEYRTNVSLQGDDYFQVDIDLSGTATDFSQFQVNPKGATNILLTGGRALKREWAGEFQAASRITPNGWETEIRIPWQVMTLPPSGKRDLRINFERFVARTIRSYAFAYFGNGIASRNPIWKSVQIPPKEVDRSVMLLPYAYAGYDPQIKGLFNSGLDLKTQLADQVQMVGSINPDFRDIEDQILSLDFSRFQRLAGESRPFFLEGSQYSGSALFASQQIPSFDAGLNSYGKLTNQTSFGVLDTVQIGRQNDFVGNLTHSPDADSSYRFGVTSLNSNGINNEAYLARYYKTMGPYSVFFRDMGTQDTVVGRGDNLNGSMNYQDSGVQVFGEYSQVTPNFLPRLGFFPEVDYKGWDGYANYAKPWSSGPFIDASVGATFLDYDRMDGSDYRRDSDYGFTGTLRNGMNFSFDEDTAQFLGSNDHLGTAAVTLPKGNPYNQFGTIYAWGKEAGIDYRSVTFTDNRRLFNKFQLIGRYQMVDYAGFNDQAILDGSYDLGKDRAINGRITKQGNNVNYYLAYRRSGNLGAEYYLILGDPNALTFHASIILKVAFPMVIGGHHAAETAKQL